jgi:Rad52/22 family double-strand break repair protein
MATTKENPLSYDQLRALFADLNPKRVKTRTTPGSSKPMSYLEAWDVKAALIRVFGPAGTSWTQQDAQIVQIEKVPKVKWVNGVKEPLPFPENFNWQITAQVRGTLTIHQTGASYGGVAVCTQVGSTFGDVADFAMKTADSDALKRGAIFLGTQFGLSLYDDGSTADIVRMSMAEDAKWPQPKPGEVVATNANGEKLLTEGTNPEGQALVERALKMAEERDNARSEDPVNEDTANGKVEQEQASE